MKETQTTSQIMTEEKISNQDFFLMMKEIVVEDMDEEALERLEAHSEDDNETDYWS
jgi:hypothetical protein